MSLVDTYLKILSMELLTYVGDSSLLILIVSTLSILLVEVIKIIFTKLNISLSKIFYILINLVINISISILTVVVFDGLPGFIETCFYIFFIFLFSFSLSTIIYNYLAKNIFMIFDIFTLKLKDVHVDLNCELTESKTRMLLAKQKNRKILENEAISKKIEERNE